MSLYQNNVAVLFVIGHIQDNRSSINVYSMKKFNNKKKRVNCFETNISFFLHWIKSFRLVFLYDYDYMVIVSPYSQSI